MWHAIRAELAYSKPWLAGALGIALGVVALMAGIFWANGGDGPDPSAAVGIRAMFPVMAPLIVTYIVLGYRVEERRARLLLAGPLTPRQLAGISILLPLCFVAIGVLATAAELFVETKISGRFSLESLNFAAYVGGMMLMMAFMVPFVQEAVAAHREGRRKASLAAWAVFIVAVAVYAVLSGGVVFLKGDNSWPILHTLNGVLSVIAAIGIVLMHPGRTDFTR